MLNYRSVTGWILPKSVPLPRPSNLSLLMSFRSLVQRRHCGNMECNWNCGNLQPPRNLKNPTSPRASQSMSFAEVGLKGRCAEGLFNAEHSAAECLWKCRWIYGRGICYTITLSHLRFFLHFTPGYTQELWAAMLENKIAVSKREQSWARP